jgi:hypothetical protein
MHAESDPSENKFYAGLYYRFRDRVRFWGWGQPTVIQAEQRWDSLADWLRLAHASFAKTAEDNSSTKTELLRVSAEPAETLTADNNTGPQSPTANEAGTQRRLRFICDRKFIGLVIR